MLETAAYGSALKFLAIFGVIGLVVGVTILLTNSPSGKPLIFAAGCFLIILSTMFFWLVVTGYRKRRVALREGSSRN